MKSLRFDNIALMPREKRVEMVRLLEFMESVEKGTAVIPIGEAVAIGNEVVYRSIARENWPAKVIDVVGEGLVDIDIWQPGAQEPVRLTRIPFVTQS